MDRSLLDLFKERCRMLNIFLNSSKELSGPVVCYQGVIIDLARKYFRISSAMKQKILAFSPTSEADGNRLCETSDVERLVGRLEWCAWLVAAGRQHLFYLLRDLQQARDQNDLKIKLSSEAEEEIGWWRQDRILSTGRSFEQCDHTYYLKGVSELVCLKVEMQHCY